MRPNATSIWGLNVCLDTTFPCVWETWISSRFSFLSFITPTPSAFLPPWGLAVSVTFRYEKINMPMYFTKCISIAHTGTYPESTSEETFVTSNRERKLTNPPKTEGPGMDLPRNCTNKIMEGMSGWQTRLVCVSHRTSNYHEVLLGYSTRSPQDALRLEQSGIWVRVGWFWTRSDVHWHDPGLLPQHPP
jgi:hypothetical protein